MPVYRVVLNGQNFPGIILGEAGRIGFYTTRFVDADDPNVAETVALELVRSDRSLDVSAAHRTLDARVLIEELDEVPAETERIPNAGFTFYPMGT